MNKAWGLSSIKCSLFGQSAANEYAVISLLCIVHLQQCVLNVCLSQSCLTLDRSSWHKALDWQFKHTEKSERKEKQTPHAFGFGLPLLYVPWKTLFTQSASLSWSCLLWAHRREPQSPERESLITVKPPTIMRNMSGGGWGEQHGVGEQETVRFSVCCWAWSEGKLRKWSKPRLSL